MSQDLRQRGAAPVRAVERAMEILCVLGQTGHPMRMSDLARASGIHKATAQRLLSALENYGFVQRERSLYQLGLGTVPLAHAFLLTDNLTKAVQPILQDLASLTGFTATLFMRHRLDRVVVLRIDGKYTLPYPMRIGQRLPLHMGAAGHVLAAAMPEEELETLLNQCGNTQLASGETRTRDDLVARLQCARQLGYAVARDERYLGVFSVAAPIVVNVRPIVASIGITGPSDAVSEEKILQLSIDVRNAARAAAEGYISG